RSAKPFHDEAGEHDYPAPYGPACCMYNTCIGHTIPYTAVTAKPESGAHTRFGVWPADADVSLEVSSAGGSGSRDRRSAHPGGNGEVLLATSDVDHDGTLELIAYELWANDFGLDVFATGSQTPSYAFSCGNI